MSCHQHNTSHRQDRLPIHKLSFISFDYPHGVVCLPAFCHSMQYVELANFAYYCFFESLYFSESQYNSRYIENVTFILELFFWTDNVHDLNKGCSQKGVLSLFLCNTSFFYFCVTLVFLLLCNTILCVFITAVTTFMSGFTSLFLFAVH